MAQELFAVVSTDYAVDAQEHLIGLFASEEAARELFEQRKAEGQFVYIQQMQVGEVLSAEEAQDRVVEVYDRFA